MHTNKTLIRTALGAFALGASLCTLPAGAQTASQSQSRANSTYAQERAACQSGQSGQSRADCMREAGAAMNEARQGKLGNQAGQDAYTKNATARCATLPMTEREECARRMQSGTVTGSVEGGGVLREHREIIPGETSSGGGTPMNSGAGMGSAPAAGSANMGTQSAPSSSGTSMGGAPAGGASGATGTGTK